MTSQRLAQEVWTGMLTVKGAVLRAEDVPTRLHVQALKEGGLALVQLRQLRFE